MKRTLIFLSILFLFACTVKKPAEVGNINFQVTEFSEVRIQARDTDKLLLAYFYTDW
ncbi:hypothetical protein KJ762_00365 [bacterium]|nr:hypothetical protein [bacterium]MBU1632949.1 hypothetical protein [bacterium]MBU1875065.1 hypothetical protein [bacterium]